MDKLHSPWIEAVWSPYNPSQDRHCGGIYIYLLKPFRNMPYYVGEATDFSERFSVEDKYFRKGEWSFLRRPFFDADSQNSHHSFVSRWKDLIEKGADDRNHLIYVPGKVPNPVIREESQSFLEHSVVRIIWKIATTAKGRKSFEEQVRTDVKRYYAHLVEHEVDLRIPGSARSFLVGAKHGNTQSTPPISYGLADGGPCESPIEFFHKLASVNFRD